MLRISVAIIAVMLLGAAALKPVASVNTALPQYGFSIDMLDAAAPDDVATTVLMTLLPPSDGFAPNMNVMIQPYQGSMNDYIALSKGQFKETNLTVVSEKKRSETEWVVEYKGLMQNNDLHFYARAIAHEGKVYLTTATAKETQWKPIANMMRKHVDSFKMNQPAKAKAAEVLD